MTDVRRSLTPEQLAKFTRENINIDAIFTPEQQPNTNVPQVDNFPTPFRFPDNDIAFDMRNALMDAYEAQYDDFILHEDVWDGNDMFVVHNGEAYYYKGNIITELAIDQQDVAASMEYVDVFNATAAGLGGDLIGPVTFADVQNIIELAPAGMPEFKREDGDFLIFESIIGKVITPRDMTRTLLDRIRDTFTGDYGPFYSPADDSLVVTDDGVYLTDLTLWNRKPSLPALGIFFDGGHMQHCYFFPFSPLSDTDKELVYSFCSLEVSKPVRIVDL